MNEVLEIILGEEDFVPYQKVYELALKQGLTKADVRKAKMELGVKTITLVQEDERIWLWYLPKNVWNKYSG